MIGFEVSCEAALIHCTIDMFSEKAFLTRWLAATTKSAPYTYNTIMPYLQASAKAAALQCSGGTNGRMCGLSWSKGADWDGTSGVGQQMAAIEVIQSNLIGQSRAPYTNTTGGTSVGNPNAGASSIQDPAAITPSTTGDRAGAGILTTFVLVGLVGGLLWMSV
jgi:mannan endo-1,6-alpha-mannosidase